MKQAEPILVAIHCMVYNHAPFLRDCFEGFVMQRTNFRFVAIVHEDASSDNSADIVREYEEKYPDIFKPIYETENQWHKTDGSLTRIMNEAIAATGAKYVALCEGDDYWTDPYKLQKQVDFMESHYEFSACYTNSVMKNVVTGEEKAAILNIWDEATPEDIILYHTDFSGDNIQCSPGHTSTLLFRYDKDMIAKRPKWMSGIMTGDILLFLSLTKYGKAKFLNCTTSVYRMHPGGVSTRRYSYENVYLERIYIFKNMKTYLDHLYDKQINQVLAHYYYALAKYAYKKQKKYIKAVRLLIKSWLIAPSHFSEMTKNNGMLIRK